MMTLSEALLRVKNTAQREFLSLRSRIEIEFPNTIKALRLIDNEYSLPRKRVGFNLVKIENKKHGFLYYVRYSHEGRMLPSKWNTHTNNVSDAERFARENKDRIVKEYLRLHENEMYDFLTNFFAEGSPYLACEEKRNRCISEKGRSRYEALITNKFVPYLKEQKINVYDRISAKTLSDFQDKLLSEGKKPQTVNDCLKAVKKIFLYTTRKGITKENPCRNLYSIPVHERDQEVRGCYEIERLTGVFNHEWKDKRSYMLCLLIYTTGMRNSEIQRIKKSDIIELEGCAFIDLKESKTENGVRLVPLHDFVRSKILSYSQDKKNDELLFDIRISIPYRKANNELAKQLKISDEEIEKENITFYSGRHFWKTLMNREGLGEEVEEMFMGHKVSNSMAKRYNHRDKQGKKLMVKKALEVFAILDKFIFSGKKG
jgi:site-specific recombinase XerD